MSKLMDKRTLQRWIREANAAGALASETALARERRVAKVKQSARKIETRIKIQLGAEALRFAKGVIAETAFKRIVADAAREIDEIDQALRASGLRRHVGKEDAANQNVPSPASAPVVASLEKVDEVAKIEVGFARVPPESLRNALKGKLGFRYDPDRQVWQGRSVPEQVVDEIRVWNAGGLVKIFLVDSRPYPLA